MAAGIRITQLILEDNMPGVVNPHLGIPAGGFDATRWNFNTSDDTANAENPPYPIGTKIMAYTDNSSAPGWYTMQYLAFHDFSSQDISYGCVSKGRAVCSRLDQVTCGTRFALDAGGDTTLAPWYVVARCTTGTTDASHGAPICFPCTSQTADSSVVLTSGDNRSYGYGHGWGWFWVGGVCPCVDITFLDDTLGDGKGADISVDSLMRPGPVMACISSDGVLLMTCDVTNPTDATGIVGVVPARVGWACCSEGR